MAKKNVFPVCKPAFNKVDFESVDESKSLDVDAIREQYKVVSSTGVLGTVIAQKSNNLVNYSQFYATQGGEYLVNNDISAPSETTLDWSGDSNGTQINLTFAESVKHSPNFPAAPVTTNGLILTDALDYNELKIGDVVCIGSKDLSGTTFDRNNLPALYHYRAEEYPDFPGYNIQELPFTEMGSGDFGFTIDANVFDNVSANPVWTTIMFIGTRWVILGSNNWV